MKKSPVTHFEMPYKDGRRVSEFYSKVFGWGMSETGEEMGHYILATTTETDENRMVQTPGNINGGFYDLKQTPGSTEPSVVIEVEDLEQSMESIKRSGGEILGEPQDIPGVGLWVSFRDSEGTRVSILQPKQEGGS
ncbi:MAG: VOC family protein [Candidatus Woykebacteria bacterium]